MSLYIGETRTLGRCFEAIVSQSGAAARRLETMTKGKEVPDENRRARNRDGRGAIAGKLVALGHEVMMGSREVRNDQARAWVGDRTVAGPWLAGRPTSSTSALSFAALGTEMYVEPWLRLWSRLGTGYFKIGVVRAEE